MIHIAWPHKPPMGVPLNLAHPLAPDLGSWSMREGMGDQIFDETANGRDGTITGADWTVGEKGYGLSFSIDRYTDIVDFGLQNLYSVPFSVEAMVLYNAPGDGDTNMIAGEADPNAGQGWMLGFNNTDTLDHKVRFWGDFVIAVTSSMVLSVAQRVHIVVTVDAATTTIYLDGNADNSGTTRTATPGADLQMGFPENPGTSFRGLNSDVFWLRMYGHVLAPAEVLSLYMRPWQAWDFVLPFSVAVGTLYTQSLAGGLTPAGAIANVALFKQQLAGGLTPAGAIRKKTSHSLAGGITPAGAITKKTLHTLGGGMTPTGAMSNVGLFLQSLAGGITPTGTIANLLNPLLLRLRMLLGVGR